jgi:hypothetical protein
MPRLIEVETYEQKVLPSGKGSMSHSVPGEGSRPAVVPQSKEAMWNSIVKSTEEITHIGERIIETRNNNEIEKAKIELLKRDVELKDKMDSVEFLKDNHYDNFVPFHTEEYSIIRNELLTNFKGTAKAKEHMSKVLDEEEIKSRSWALGRAQEREISDRQVGYLDRTKERGRLFTDASLKKDIDTQNRVLAEQFGDTQEMINTRTIDAVFGKRNDEEFLKDANNTTFITMIDEAAAMGTDLNNPIGLKTSTSLLENLVEQLSEPMENMDDTQRLYLKNQAQQELNNVKGKVKILRQNEYLGRAKEREARIETAVRTGNYNQVASIVREHEIDTNSQVLGEVMTPIQGNDYARGFKGKAQYSLQMTRIADAAALADNKDNPNAIDVAANSLRNLIAEYKSNNPNIDDDDQMAFRLRAEAELKGVLKIKDEKDYVSFQELERGTKNDIAQLYDGKEPNISAREAEIDRLFADKPEKGKAFLEEYRYNIKIARDAGVFIKRLPTASLEEEAALLKEVEANKTSDNYADWDKIQEAFVRAVEDKHTRMEKDLAGYTQEVFKTTNPFEMVEHQRKMGVSPSEFSVVSKEKSSTMVNNLKKIATGEDRVGAFDIIRKEYGEHMPIVIDDLIKAGLSDTLVLVAYMDKPEQREQAIRIAETINMKDGELTDLALTASTENITKSDLTTHIEDTTKTEAHSFFTAIQNSFGTKDEVLAEMDRVKKVIFRGTLINMVTDGSTVADATEKTVKAVITDSYTISKDGMYVIPNYTKLNPRKVELVCEGFLNNLKKEDLASGHRNEYNEKEYYRAAKNGGWVNSKNFTGLQLVTRGGVDVLDRNLNPIILTWTEIEKGETASAFLSNTKADMRVVNKLKEVATGIAKSSIEKGKKGAKSTIEKIKEAPSSAIEGAAFVKKTLEPKEQQEKPLTPGKWKVTEPVVPLEKKVPKSERPEDWRTTNANP